MDDVTYRLPDGLDVESGVQKTTIPWAEHAELRMASQPDKGSLRIVRSIAYNFTLLDPKDYANLHDFYQKVATADQQQVVLARAPNAPK
jgi:hypothetical protein